MEIKDLLNEEMYNNYVAIQEALKGKGPQGRDIELVATNTGDYVPATKYDKLKADYNKVSTDYATLNSKYESDLAAVKSEGETTLKKVLVNNMLEKAGVTKVNNSYDYLSTVLDLSNVKIENGTLSGADTIVKDFVTKNPMLVNAVQSAQPAQQSNVAIPSTTGLNPASPVSNVKDLAYYKDAYSNAPDLETRIQIKENASKDGIMI